MTKLFSAGGGSPIHLQGAELLDGIVSPAFGTNQNDLAFDATAAGCCLRIRLSASISITGMANGQANRLVLINNDSAFNLSLPDRSGASQPQNQFNNGGTTLALQPTGFAYYLYNPRTLVWDLVQSYAGATAAPSAVVVSVVKPADTTRTNTGVVTNDPDLAFPIQPAGSYALTFSIHVTTPAAAQGGLTSGLTTNGAITVGNQSLYFADTSGTVYTQFATNIGGSINQALAVSRTVQLLISATLVQSTAGVIAFAWALQSPAGNSTTVKQGSWGTLVKVA